MTLEKKFLGHVRGVLGKTSRLFLFKPPLGLESRVAFRVTLLKSKVDIELFEKELMVYISNLVSFKEKLRPRQHVSNTYQEIREYLQGQLLGEVAHYVIKASLYAATTVSLDEVKHKTPSTTRALYEIDKTYGHFLELGADELFDGIQTPDVVLSRMSNIISLIKKEKESSYRGKPKHDFNHYLFMTQNSLFS